MVSAAWLCPKRPSAALPRYLSAALHLCCVSVLSEASRTLPSLESIQKVFEQQLHPGIHQRSQVSWLEGGRRSRKRSAGAVSMWGGGFWLHRGDRWDSGGQSPLLFSLAPLWLQCRGHTVSYIPTVSLLPQSPLPALPSCPRGRCSKLPEHFHLLTLSQPVDQDCTFLLP